MVPLRSPWVLILKKEKSIVDLKRFVKCSQGRMKLWWWFIWLYSLVLEELRIFRKERTSLGVSGAKFEA